MIYREEEYLQLSGLQHFAFCRRQWALIHVEQQWKENLRTVEGNLLHGRAHDEQARERRGDTLILRGLSVSSSVLGISGKCDVVEFHADPNGVPLNGETGLWAPIPVEYKRVHPKCIRRMNCSCVRRPCVWRRCSAAPYQKELFSTGRPDGGRQFPLHRNFGIRSVLCWRRCTGFMLVDIHRKSNLQRDAVPAH